MTISSKDIVPLTRARARLTELCEEVRDGGTEKIITRNGESFAALVGAERLDYYHRLEREHIHLVLLDDALRGLADLERGAILRPEELASRHGHD